MQTLTWRNNHVINWSFANCQACLLETTYNRCYYMLEKWLINSIIVSRSHLALCSHVCRGDLKRSRSALHTKAASAKRPCSSGVTRSIVGIWKWKVFRASRFLSAALRILALSPVVSTWPCLTGTPLTRIIPELRRANTYLQRAELPTYTCQRAHPCKLWGRWTTLQRHW